MGIVDPIGSADSLFVQATSANMSPLDSIYNDKGFNRMATCGELKEFRIELDESLLGFGTYQYHNNNRGAKTGGFGFGADIDAETNPILHQWTRLSAETYKKRDNVFEFLQKQFYSPTTYHELMLKGNLPPEFIKSIRVENVQERDALLVYFAEKGHLVEGKLFGRDVDTFIQVEGDGSLPSRSSSHKANFMTDMKGYMGYIYLKEMFMDPILWAFDQAMKSNSSNKSG
jgi:hypothetical protein